MLRMGRQLQGIHVHPLGLTGTVCFQGRKLEEEEPTTGVLSSQHPGAWQCLFNHHSRLHFEVPFWDSLVVQWLTLCTPTQGPVWIPGQGTWDPNKRRN